MAPREHDGGDHERRRHPAADRQTLVANRPRKAERKEWVHEGVCADRCRWRDTEEPSVGAEAADSSAENQKGERRHAAWGDAGRMPPPEFAKKGARDREHNRPGSQL